MKLNCISCGWESDKIISECAQCGMEDPFQILEIKLLLFALFSAIKAPLGRWSDEFTITSETMSAVISHTPTGWGETDMAAGLEIHLITHKPIVFRQGVVAAPYVVRGECTITPFE